MPQMRLVSLLLLLGLLLAGCLKDQPAARPAPAEAEAVAQEEAAEPAPQEPQAPALAYEERLTLGASAQDKLPLIVAVHGLGDNPKAFVRLLERLDFPARVIAPQGLEAYGRGYSWFPLSQPRGNFDGLAPQVRQAADQLAALIRGLKQKHPEHGPVILTGFSQGGILSFAVAALHGEEIDLALPLAGYLPASLAPLPGAAPICALHGDADQRVPTEITVKRVEALQRQGAQVRLKLYPGVGHSLPGELRADLFAALKGASTGGDPMAACPAPAPQ